ncbi:hypothetical protein MD484_g8225, partial [Candolleomyces efflorescens]
MVLIQFKLGEDVPALDADRLRIGVNKALVQSQSTLRMESGNFAYGGYGLHMNGVASQQELDVLRGAIIAICAEAGYKGQLWVGLPQSTSYLKIRNAPYFWDGDLSVRTTSVDIINAFRASPLSDWFKPAAPARIDRESKASTSATVYLNIWDSTSGSNANALINKRVSIFGVACTISAAAANPRVPLCQNCWRWGHPTSACRSASTCPKCGGPHREHEHRRCCGLCKGNAKATPPVAPTPADDLPHLDYMGGDPNCHSHTAASLGLEYARPVNPGPTFIARADGNSRLVIDLVFVQPSEIIRAHVCRESDLQGQSDHTPLSTVIPLRLKQPKHKGQTLKPFSDEEKEFIADIIIGMSKLTGYTPTTVRELDFAANTIAEVFSSAWSKHLTEFTISAKSKEYWTGECTKALEEYRADLSVEKHKAFRSTVKAAKRKFFDARIEEISETRGSLIPNHHHQKISHSGFG